MTDAPQEVRCHCSRRPLLAKAGIEDGKPFLWVRHMKASKVLVDLKVRTGTVDIVCRECRRVCRVTLGDVMKVGVEAPA